MLSNQLTPAQKERFDKDGYIIIKSFCSSAEINELYSTAIDDNVIRNNALDLNDQSGEKTFTMVYAGR